MKITNPNRSYQKQAKGFSTPESLGFLVALLLAGFLNFKGITTLQGELTEGKKTHGLVQLENAKTRFTQDADAEDRQKFNGMTNEARFAQLSPFLSPSDPLGFSKAHGLENIDIGDLSKQPTAK